MKIENQERIKNLKEGLQTALKHKYDYIQNQYNDSETEARNIHLAVYRTTDHEISNFIFKIDETMAQVNFKDEDNWVKDKEEKAKSFFYDIKGLQ
jgi:hypothetical protein